MRVIVFLWIDFAMRTIVFLLILSLLIVLEMMILLMMILEMIAMSQIESNLLICGQTSSWEDIRWCRRWISRAACISTSLLRFTRWVLLLEVRRTEILRWWCSCLSIFIHFVFAKHLAFVASECLIHLIWNRSQFISQNLSEIALTDLYSWNLSSFRCWFFAKCTRFCLSDWWE